MSEKICKIGATEPILHVFFKVVATFDPHLGKVLHSLTWFQNIKNKHFANRLFLFTPCHKGNECALILTDTTANSYLGPIQKKQELASSGYRNNWCCASQFLFLCISGHFLGYLMTSQQILREIVQNC